MRWLVQELIGVVLITCRKRQEHIKELISELQIHSQHQRHDDSGMAHANMCMCLVYSYCTFKKIDLLPSVVSGSRQSKRCIYVIRDCIEAYADVSRVVIV